ncbi:Benzoate 4-monooxygenase [Fulvia fulva]|uniref:Benzoate 4-monooxygenase n=1 Tax=Passalora fulva TaxID=5499 RepID=A0A9Q8P9Z6_PASFU|nr:Benzoate 4-monooxygenase [Fulvia fulva]KAK4622190.1 Benzoate 4-monooxygenase [Fulvia fulva]KAK4623133.1 Benzoate 4-monooxygenase [Fulvia fulva]UJO18629.1 Benzoate 4-monooxygenase [Fulvia fulva]WPV15693.1 Benzoate 4-monooxygenase [Fulvia fulva]WPV30804.1 Benzoate 4-monooxygenase [Fulvia fulva]
MAGNLRRWVRQLDRIASFPTSRSGFAKISMMPWCTFIAFDIIGDLAFGAPFGMLDKGRDECEAQLEPHGPIVLAPGAETLNRRGEVSSTLGLMLSLKPWAKWLPDPFFTNGLKSARNLHGIATVAVSKRRDSTEHATDKGNKQRHDILDMLVNAKDSKGNPMPRDELISEALTQLIAGSDTVSNTACATFYWILHGERAAPGSIVPRLQAELDAAIPANSDIASHAEVKNLPFLRRCVDEAMRLHSTTAIGLPRIVTPASGVQYQGDVFPRGTVLSVPSYTIHRDAEVWGPDVEDFKPDRWLPENLTARQKICFNPFSFGPRACVGQNVAHMELALIIGTAFHRYDFELYQQELESHEGFSKKPDEFWVGIRKRSQIPI